MKKLSTRLGFESLLAQLTCVSSIVLLLSATASAEPPGRGAERGARNNRPLLADSWLHAQQHVQRDFSAARNNVRRDFGRIRDSARQEAARMRYQMEHRRPRGFQFEHVLDALFGRPGTNPRPQPYQQRNQAGSNDYYHDKSGDEQSPPLSQTGDQWQREDKWAEQFEGQLSRNETPQLNRRSRTESYRNERQPVFEPLLETTRAQEPRIPRERVDAPVQLQNKQIEENRPPAAVTSARQYSTDSPERNPTLDTSNLRPNRSTSGINTDPILTGDNRPTSPANQVETTSTFNRASQAAKVVTYPYGLPVPGKAGMVYSPYIEDSRKYVDVRNIPAGTLVKDPYTSKYFKVP